MRTTKIVATLGPATNTPEVIAKLLEAGVNVFRVNMSHGTQADHSARIRMVREVCQSTGKRAGLLLDLQGPKIRIGKFAEGKVTLESGDRFTFDIDFELGDQLVHVDDVAAGQHCPGLGDRRRMNGDVFVLVGRVRRGGTADDYGHIGDVDSHCGRTR